VFQVNHALWETSRESAHVQSPNQRNGTTTNPVSLQHVQTKQEVHVWLIQHGEWTIEKRAANLQLRNVHTSNDGSRAHANRLPISPTITTGWSHTPVTDTYPASKPCVDQPHDPTLLSTLLGHDGVLRTTVHERFQRNAVHLGIDIQHRDPASTNAGTQTMRASEPDTRTWVTRHTPKEHFGCVFHGQQSILLNVLQADQFLQLGLCVSIIRIRS
jgi:hypothetical protein